MCIRDRHRHASVSTTPPRKEIHALVSDARSIRERRPFRRPTYGHGKSQEAQPRQETRETQRKEYVCYNCGKSGHLSRYCKQKRNNQKIHYPKNM